MGDTSYQTYECTHNDSALTEAVSANKGESYVQYSDGEWEDFSELEWSSKKKKIMQIFALRCFLILGILRKQHRRRCQR